MQRSHVTEDDEGKRVVNTSGDKMGRISNVEGGKAFVDPDPGVTDTIRSKLGWGKEDQDDYQLHADRIDTITDNEVRLKDNL